MRIGSRGRSSEESEDAEAEGDGGNGGKDGLRGGVVNGDRSARSMFDRTGELPAEGKLSATVTVDGRTESGSGQLSLGVDAPSTVSVVFSV